MGFELLVGRNDLFFELYSEVIGFSLLYTLTSPLLSLPIYLISFLGGSFFHKRVIIYSILLTTFLVGINISIQYHLEGLHISDAIVNTLISVCILITATLICSVFLKIKSILVKHKNNTDNDVNLKLKIESTPFVLQVLFLSLINSIFISYILIPIPLILLFIPIGGFFVYNVQKIQDIKTQKIKWSDYIFFLLIICLLFGLGFVTIGDFVCSIPWFCDFFSCHNHYF